VLSPALSEVAVMSWWQIVDWRLAAEVVSLVLAILALAVGIYHLIEIRHASKSLSTRYLGKFPFFLPEINEVLASARNEVVIFCDFPGYGGFTDPTHALEYRQILERQIQRGLTVELTCMNEEHRRKYSSEQLTESQWEDWLKQPLNRDRAGAFVTAHVGAIIAHSITFAQLHETLENVDRSILTQVFHDRAAQLPIDMPIYFWIADGRVAVFSIPALSDEAQEYGFRTSDHALIQALLEIRLRFRRKFGAANDARGSKDTG
jgi:hypothetical protein